MNWLINLVHAEGPEGVVLLDQSILNASTSAGHTLTSYMYELTSIFFTLVIIAAVIRITIGGIQYILSGGSDGKSEAKDHIWGAIWGLLLALAAVLILKTINPELTVFKLFFEL